MAPPPSHSQSVLPGRNILVLESISDERTHFILKVRCEQAARCPGCRKTSTACHSRYVRILQDLPWQGRSVYLWVTVRRFRCRNRRCSRKIFAERLPDIGRQYARRTARLLEVVRLVGYSQRAIADRLHMERKTVRRFLRADGFPERKAPRRAPPKVEQHAEYLQQRWNEGCHNATTLFQELRARGYKGGRSMVARHVSSWRKKFKSEQRKGPKRITPRQAAMLVCKPGDRMTEEQQNLYSQLLTNCPMLGLMRVLAEEFRGALFGGDASKMRDWIHTAIQSGIGPLIRFGYGLRKDLRAVSAAIETRWSSGQVEGHINRLKTIKRQMYGRAGFNLLRSRVLAFTPASPP